jgi:hypothetical protein
MNSAVSSGESLRLSRSLREEKQLRCALWREAFRQGSVWLRAVKFGFTTGLLQAVVNQGNHWLQHAITTEVVVKTIVSPLIGFSLVLLTSCATWVQKSLEEKSYER